MHFSVLSFNIIMNKTGNTHWDVWKIGKWQFSISQLKKTISYEPNDLIWKFLREAQTIKWLILGSESTPWTKCMYIPWKWLIIVNDPQFK